MFNRPRLLQKMEKVRRLTMLKSVMAHNPTPALNQLDVKLTRYL